MGDYYQHYLASLFTGAGAQGYPAMNMNINVNMNMGNMNIPLSYQGMPQGMPHGTPHGTPYGTPPGISQGMPQGMHHGMPQGMPHERPHGMSHGTVQGVPQGMPIPMRPLSPEKSSRPVGYFDGRDFYDMGKSQKGRKKTAGHAMGTEVVKHRRTRSGCYTCRGRRVKCDEKRPTCERCSKGNRDCVYPEPRAPKGGKSKDLTVPAQTGSPSSSAGDAEDENDMDVKATRLKMETIPDQDESDEAEEPLEKSISHSSFRFAAVTSAPSRSPSAEVRGSRQGSETSALGDKASSTSTLGVSKSKSSGSIRHSSERPDYTHLPGDMKYYMDWFYNNITVYHYTISVDADDFFTTILPGAALNDEALLNAVVGFAAYHSTLANTEGKLEDFLKYYTNSVTILLLSLKRKEQASIYTLLTILQLATMEEYLGDWVNLMGHQSAAFEIFVKLFPLDTFTDTPTGRTVFSWYARFDSFVALMGGFTMRVPREYFDKVISFYESQIQTDDDNIHWKCAQRSMQYRRIAWDMSLLYCQDARDGIDPDTYNSVHEKLLQDFADWRENWDPELTDSKHLVKDLPEVKYDPNNVVEPVKSGVLFDKPVLSTTMIVPEWLSTYMLHMVKSKTKSPVEQYPELSKYAYEICQHFEAIDGWSEKPNGALTPLNSCFQMAIMFLPPDEKHNMWVRRKLAQMELQGHIYPQYHRMKYVEHFRDPTCEHWWLPNEENFTPLMRSMREFTKERNAAALTAQQEAVREVRHILPRLGNGESKDGP